jgi:hypothetical protein
MKLGGLIQYLPDISSPYGVILYALCVYLIVWFSSWLFREPMTGHKDKDVELKTRAEMERLR